ncbi:MerR family transcriptional regulator [Anaeromicropila herbilytica]|uniref:HTH merR-type domain-containing protein n=1 Tax=Anaeromicropila herbilytica TaxID=2785025 RepID=A0A7R7IGA3_9FIRM|nr:MerR family transcriptional regulator [Anaeromicropila herbilytica]BCN32888.1 hypothetical protein bsdtb5_41830 [Anaeromicropila herbilytica]
MTIHELANLSGISVRTLHYYDKIDLLKPFCVEQNGYRNYNEDSIRRLQQIMFYKELDLPLKTIKNIMNQPGFNQKEAIRVQKELITAKRNRLTRLIGQMDKILEGNDTVDLSVFEYKELEEVFTNQIMKLEEEYRQFIIEKHGSVEAYVKDMMSRGDKIKESAIKYYGSLGDYIEALKNQEMPKEGMGKLQVKLDGLVKQIAEYQGEDIEKSEIQALVKEWEQTFKTMIKVQEVDVDHEKCSEICRNIYHSYINNKDIIKYLDGIYGEGACIYVGKAMEYYDLHQGF